MAVSPLARPSDLPVVNSQNALYFDLDASVPQRFEEAISSAVATWASHLDRTPVRCAGCPGAGVIRVRFVSGDHGDPFPFTADSAKVAHVVSYKSGNTAPEVHINRDRFLGNADADPAMYTVALHEIGHVLGLTHSASQASVMYPWYNAGGKIIEEDLKSQFRSSRFLLGATGVPPQAEAAYTTH